MKRLGTALALGAILFASEGCERQQQGKPVVGGIQKNARRHAINVMDDNAVHAEIALLLHETTVLAKSLNMKGDKTDRRAKAKELGDRLEELLTERPQYITHPNLKDELPHARFFLKEMQKDSPDFIRIGD
jgi:hypothetical protein